MFERRLEALRRGLADARLDALLVTHLPHVRYLTGFSGSNGLSLITLRSQYFLTDVRYGEQAASEVRNYRLIVTKTSLFESLPRCRALAGKIRLGIQDSSLSVAAFQALKRMFARARFIPARQIVERLVSVKERSEIDAIRRAAQITDLVFSKITSVLKAGLRELDVAAEIGYLHRTLGADGDAFEPIVASGRRSALPHARATTRRIRSGELIVLDFGCRIRGYNSDFTRTVVLGKASAKALMIHRIVLEAQSRAIEAARSGLSARALDAVARSHIRKYGYGRFFNHSLGHGLGLEVHESPRLSARSTDELVNGNVVTIEPGIYIPGFGGVRIENDIVVREDHAEVLNTSPRELLSI